MCGHPLEHSQLTRCYTLRESWFSSQQPPVVSSSSARNGTSCPPPISVLGLVWHAVTITVSSYLLYPQDTYYLLSVPLTVLSPLRVRRHMQYTPFSAELPPPTLEFFNHRISQWDNRKFYTKKKDTIQNRGLPSRALLILNLTEQQWWSVFTVNLTDKI